MNKTIDKINTRTVKQIKCNLYANETIRHVSMKLFYETIL